MTSLGGAANGFSGCLRGRGVGGANSCLKPGALATGWKEEAEAEATTGCSVRKAAATGAGAGLCTAAAPGFPPAASCPAQELPEVGEPELTCACSPYPGPRIRGIPGRQGPLYQGSKMSSCRPPPPPLTRSEKPLNPG